MPHTIVVTGSRDWTDADTIQKTLTEIDIEQSGVYGVTLIEGGAQGADRIARDLAKSLGWKVITIKADWSLGPRAGPIRNRKMLDLKPDEVIAFRLGETRGTADCIREAKQRGIPVRIVEIKP